MNLTKRQLQVVDILFILSSKKIQWEHNMLSIEEYLDDCEKLMLILTRKI